MCAHRPAQPKGLWRLCPGRARLYLGLGGALLLTLFAACSLAPQTGAVAQTVTPTASPTATATPRPLAPAAPGVYALTLQALDVLSPTDGTVQHSYPYDNPGAAGTGTVLSAMVITGGTVYVVAGGTPSGAVVLALRASDGGELWHFIIPRSSSAPGLSVVDGVVFVAAWAVGFPGTFYAISAADGHELWNVQVATIWPYATVANGVVYLPVQPNDGHQHLLALRATDGKQLWDYQVPSCGGLNTPAVDNRMVYLSCGYKVGDMGDVYGLRASDGSLIWHDGDLGLSAFSPVAGDGNVYVVSGGCGPIAQSNCQQPSYTYALDEQTGATRWRGLACGDSVALDATALYCRIDETGDALAALDPATGTVRWHYSLAGVSRPESGLTLAGGALFFEGDEQLIAVDAATGTLRWQTVLADRSNPALVVFVVP